MRTFVLTRLTLPRNSNVNLGRKQFPQCLLGERKTCKHANNLCANAPSFLMNCASPYIKFQECYFGEQDLRTKVE